MEILFMLIGFSLLVALLFLGAFVRAVKTGQYEDCYTPAIRMLFDDSPAELSIHSSGNSSGSPSSGSIGENNYVE
jgi:cbb3-type cytochrome oxidase maturation protein